MKATIEKFRDGYVLLDEYGHTIAIAYSESYKNYLVELYNVQE